MQQPIAGRPWNGEKPFPELQTGSGSQTTNVPSEATGLQTGHEKSSLKMEEELVLVLSVLEGRNFPSDPYPLVIRATFDGDTLDSDPVKPAASPIFDQELGWTMGKRTWHHYRLARHVLKLLCMQKKEEGGEQRLGYLVLHLQSLQLGAEKVTTWRRLLGLGTHRQQGMATIAPELLVSLSLEQEVKEEPQSRRSEGKEEPRLPLHLIPVMKNHLGYVQIGPDQQANQFFYVTLIIVYAKNLQALLPKSVPPPSALPVCHFFFDFLGCRIKTDSFEGFPDPQFTAEQTQGRVLTSPRLLRQYFKALEHVDVVLMCDDIVLGAAQMDLAPLLSQWGSFPILHEAPFHIRPQLEGGEVGAEMGLSLEVALGPNMHEKGCSWEKENVPPPSQKQQQHIPERLPFEQKEKKQKTGSLQTSDDPEKKKKSILTLASRKNRPEINSLAHGSSGDAKVVKIEDSDEEEEVVEVDRVPSQEETSAAQMKHYIMIISLQKVFFREGFLPAQCYFRYTYPHLGLTKPVTTEPPLHLTPSSAQPMTIPDGLRELSVALNPLHLASILRQHPLKVEVRESESAATFARAQVDLSLLLASPEKGSKKSCLVEAPLKKEGHDEDVGKLVLKLVLQDVGVFQLTHDDKGHLKEEAHGAAKDMVYKAAKELEDWKERAQIIFQKKLEEEKESQLAMLSAEWCKRETEREASFQLRLAELQRREAEMKEALHAMEKQATRMSQEEDALQKQMEDVKKEAAWKMQTAREASRRMQDKFEHEIAMEKARNAALKEEVSQLQEEVKHLQQQNKEKEAEAMQLPMAKMQHQIHILLQEKAHLEGRLERAQQSNLDTKANLQKVLEEARKLQAHRQQDVQERMERERLEALAKTGVQELQTDRAILQEIRQQMAALKQRSERESSPKKKEEMSEEEKRLAQLMEERDSLLATGIYFPDDIIITNIDKEIGQVMGASDLV